VITVTKTLTFAAGHRLVGHTKCSNIHGHTWHVEIEVGGDLRGDGMVADFSEIKDRLGKFIADNLDHSMLLARDDYEAQNALRPLNVRVFLFDAPPTAEVIARRLLVQARGSFPGVQSVTVWESPTARATARPALGATP